MLGVPSGGREWKVFKESVCYEIFGDILSLQDIDEILLGNVSNIPRFIDYVVSSIPAVEALKYLDSIISTPNSKTFPCAQYLLSTLDCQDLSLVPVGLLQDKKTIAPPEEFAIGDSFWTSISLSYHIQMVYSYNLQTI